MSEDVAIERFWHTARVHARLTNSVPSYFGPSALELLRPPAWAFGHDPQMADRLLSLVLAGTKTATSSAHRWYDPAHADAEPLPEVGNLDIVLDGAGHPRALLATTEVRVISFEAVDEAFAHDEGEGDRSLAGWRAAHEKFFRAEGTWDPQMLVVCQRFDVLFQD